MTGWPSRIQRRALEFRRYGIPDYMKTLEERMFEEKTGIGKPAHTIKIPAQLLWKTNNPNYSRGRDRGRGKGRGQSYHQKFKQELTEEIKQDIYSERKSQKTESKAKNIRCKKNGEGDGNVLLKCAAWPYFVIENTKCDTTLTT